VNLQEWLELLSWKDLVDIALVAVVTYNLLLLIRGTRAVQVLGGILLLGGVYYVAGATGLAALEGLLEKLFIALPIAIVVLFQQEIRRALASFGRNPLLGLGAHEEAATAINDIVLAASGLSSERIGALIVVQRLQGLRNYVESGIVLDARISYDLLVNIFNPETPLHDGAVIIQGDRVASAACFLPLTQTANLSKEFGTRHRAALGISEETDALAVVVSEETGKVSIALGGQLIRDLDAKNLRNTLYQYLIAEPTTQPRGEQ
jgi:diadenylate cyclase